MFRFRKYELIEVNVWPLVALALVVSVGVLLATRKHQRSLQ